MTRDLRRLVLALVVLSVAGVMTLRWQRVPDPAAAEAVAPVGGHGVATPSVPPRLVDVGADQCIPCKMMLPVLDELRTEYAGRLHVDFVDAWKNPAAAEPYHVYGIPTQIFYAPDGRELSRHLGFISKADVLATWQKLGFELRPVAVVK
jgi:thioredoxin 1